MTSSRKDAVPTADSPAPPSPAPPPPLGRNFATLLTPFTIASTVTHNAAATPTTVSPNHRSTKKNEKNGSVLSKDCGEQHMYHLEGGRTQCSLCTKICARTPAPGAGVQTLRADGRLMVGLPVYSG